MFEAVPTVKEVVGVAAFGAFVLGQLIQAAGRERAGRTLGSVAWVLFGVFWVTMLPTFVGMRSVVETLLAMLAVPLCLVAARAFWQGRDGVAMLSRAVGVMGIVYGLAIAVPTVRKRLVETVATHTEMGIRALGYEVSRQISPVNGFDSQFVFTDAAGNEYVTFIVLACTGIGAIAAFTGIVVATPAPLGRKVRALAVVVAAVWVLNVVRNVFIAVAFGDQWFQAAPLIELSRTVGYADPALASYFVADRVLSQSVSVVAILGLAVLLIRLLPETTTLFEAVLYLVTGREYVVHTDFRITRVDGS